MKLPVPDDPKGSLTVRRLSVTALPSAIKDRFIPGPASNTLNLFCIW